MIFITDLDRTLIYSSRVTEQYQTPDFIDAVAIETKDGREISCTSKNLVEWLKSDDRPIVIANTARSIEEFNRIDISNYFDYAIVANGGVIMHNGKILEDWEKYLNRGEFQDSLIDMHKEIANMKSSSYSPKIINQSYIFSKPDNLELADVEIQSLSDRYKVKMT